MNRLLLLASAASFAVALPASAETRTYDVSAFEAIHVSSGMRVTFEAGPTQSIIAETEKADLDKIVIEVEDGTLNIKRKRRGVGWGRTHPVTVTVSGPAVHTVIASSGSSVSADGVSGDAIKLRASSGSSLSVENVSGGSVDTSASSGASLSARGACTDHEVDASSGASVSTRELQCVSVEADASSGASLSAYASETVDAEASSGASVSVGGGATNVAKDRSSGGSISVN